jgi:hypothetical protein
VRHPTSQGYTGAEVNRLWREELGPLLSPADKVSLAHLLGVSVRTIQRWTTTSAEQRSPIPPQYAGNTLWAADDRYGGRGDVVDRIGKPILLNEPNEGGAEQCFTELFSTVADALDWQIALVDGDLDDFLAQAATSTTLTLGAEGWEVEVCYDRTLFQSPGLEAEPE